MEHRLLGASGFQLPVLSFGTATFGGAGAFAGFGASDVADATRLVDIGLDAPGRFRVSSRFSLAG